MEIDIIISVNVYRSINTLYKQLETIDRHVLNSYVVILNCNESMYNEVKDLNLKHVKINPIIINKKPHSGLLTKGIVSNMNYALENYNFKHYIILSGRTIFYKDISTLHLNILSKKWKNLDEMKKDRILPFTKSHWHWPTFTQTLLAKFYLDKGYYLDGSYHEGLCFSFNVVSNIVLFLNEQDEIRENLFNFEFSAVEEFSLQTISLNEVNTSNLEYGYINICYGWTLDDYKNETYVKKIDFL